MQASSNNSDIENGFKKSKERSENRYVVNFKEKWQMGNVEALNPKGFSQRFQFCLGYDTGTCLIAVRWAKPTNAQNPALAFQLENKVLTLYNSNI